jgi:rRNA maturation endonuclease Nob1
MLECRTCKAQIAYNAKFCPKCGEREPNATIYRITSITTLVVVIIFIIFAITLLF